MPSAAAAATVNTLVRPLLRLALALLHLLALLLALVPAFPPSSRRRPRLASPTADDATKPPPKHVQLLLVAPTDAGQSTAREAAVGRLVVESVARAVAWATAEGVTELSVFEPSGPSPSGPGLTEADPVGGPTDEPALLATFHVDLLPKLHGELVFRLTARPPTPPSSTPSSPPFPVDRRPLPRQSPSLEAARSHPSGWTDGWVTIECGRPAGEGSEDDVRGGSASGPSGSSVLLRPTSRTGSGGTKGTSASGSTSSGLRLRNPPSHSSDFVDDLADTQRTDRPQRPPLNVHLLTTQSSQPLLTELARNFAAEPNPAEIEVGSVTAALGRRLPFAHLDPDLLIIHRLEPYGVDDVAPNAPEARLSTKLSEGRSTQSSQRSTPADPGSRPAYWSPARLARRWVLSLARAAAVRASDQPGSMWLASGAESVRLYGIGVWGLRVTEI
jgi:hypothetical protein